MKRLLPATLFTTALAAITLGAAPNTPVAPVPAPVPTAAHATLLTNALWLDTLGVDNIEQAWGTPGKNKSVDGHAITLRGTVFAHGVGSHAAGEFHIPLDGKAERFLATVGIDDEVAAKGSARVIDTVDNKEVFRSPVLIGGGPLANLDISLASAKNLLITLSDEGNNDSDHVDFGNAQLVFAAAPANPNTVRIAAPAPVVAEEKITLPLSTPADGKPQINGPRITSGTPGHIFLFRIPATGDAPLAFSADNLPAGLSLDAATGIITGSLKAPLSVATTLHVKNAKGEATRDLVIVGGDHKLALTPPLGWNSWNAWGTSVSDEKVRAAADSYDKFGLANHGFQYINIDDGWEVRGGGANTRDAQGNILTNNKFPNMKALGDYIHAKGLKFGIYSSPGPTTCGGYAASWQHELQDATTWTSWGVDYIKYDWCSYSSVAPQINGAVGGRPNANSFSLDTLKKPYKDIRTALDKQDRDIVMSLCQYGWGNVWEWGAEDGINGNVWRATGDINDSWNSMANIGFQQNGHEAFIAPGHWNDTDMLVVGKVGWNDRQTHDTKLTQNEQLLHISLWSVLAAPLLLGCDLTQLDPFTTALMSNDEVLAVNQDPLGKQGFRVWPLAPEGSRNPAHAMDGAPQQVWARQLWDGTIAVGLFNRGNDPAPITITLKQLNDSLKTSIPAGAPVRDLWQLKNLAPAGDAISAQVARHGVVLLKIGTPAPEADNIAALVKMHAPK